MKIAVIKTGGKQYLVREGDEIKIEKISVDKDGEYFFDEVLLVGDEDGKDLKIGKPFLKDVKIEAKVLDQTRDKKVRVVHYKSKTRHHKVYGHRQLKTKIKIIKIK